MNNISQKLNELFQKHDLIFWYDDEGKLRDAYDTLEIEAKKLEVNSNQFGIKYKILSSSKNSKFLIYSTHKEPSYADNWLLDLQLKSYLFSADRVSMVMNELFINPVYKPFVQKHINFFDAKSRCDALAKLLDPQDDDKQLALKMIASIVKCEAKIPHIIMKLLSNDKPYGELQKYALDEYLWSEVAKQFKYKSEGATLKDFGFKLLQNHFYSYLNKRECELNKEAILFVKNWMDSSSNAQSYSDLAKSVESELSIASILSSYKLEDMVECDTYDACEKMILSGISRALISESFDAQKILEIITLREHKFWHEGYKNIYLAFEAATKLMRLVDELMIEVKSFDDGFESYSDEWFEVDYYYRKYIYHSSASEHANILKELDERIENLYLNRYLRPLGDSWQRSIKEYQNSTHPFQKDFYKNHVSPLLEKGQKVFVIISDALRYEAAYELANRINGLNRYSAEITPMVGVLPSFTQLGVASLLPNRSLGFDGKDDSVYVDGVNSKGSANRDKILKFTCQEASYIDSESFLNFNRDDGRAFAKANSVIYIYHNEIDATGDKSASEHKVFSAVEESFVTLENIIKAIYNMNGSNLFITSDHGFLYQDRPTAESEFCKVDKEESAKRFNRRFIIAPEIQDNGCIDIYEAQEFNLTGNEKIAFANSINKIRMQGGGHRFVHGGATLQEMVVPLISVKKRRRDDVRDVEISCLLPSQITTNSVMISFYQEEAISDKLKPVALKIAFYTHDNELLSNMQSFTFDSADAHNRNRESKLRFDFKQKAGEHSGENIKLVLKKIISSSNEEPLYKEYTIKLKLSFLNDFDEF